MVTTKYNLWVGDEVIDVRGGGYLFGQLDSVIGNAQEAYSALRYQRSTFGDISTKINTISTKLPIVSITKCLLLFNMLIISPKSTFQLFQFQIQIISDYVEVV